MTWIIVIFLGVVIPLLDREFKILGFLQEVYAILSRNTCIHRAVAIYDM